MMKLKRLTFNRLTLNYHPDSKNVHTCNMHFPNTCAIRLSEALFRSYKNNDLEKLKSFIAKSKKNICSHGYVRGAQDLGAILQLAYGFRDRGWNKPDEVPSEIVGKKGILCFMKLPEFPGQGHITIWNGEETVDETFPYYWSSETIWFWELL